MRRDFGRGGLSGKRIQTVSFIRRKITQKRLNFVGIILLELVLMENKNVGLFMTKKMQTQMLVNIFVTFEKTLVVIRQSF